MKTRYRLICRGIRGGAYYCVDTTTSKRTSLGTTNADDAQEQFRTPARFESANRQTVSGGQRQRHCYARTWQHALEALIGAKQGANQHHWKTAAKDKAFVPLLPRVIIETPGDLLLKVLENGTVSTNVYLRRLHNFCADMNWLPWPLVPKRQ